LWSVEVTHSVLILAQQQQHEKSNQDRHHVPCCQGIRLRRVVPDLTVDLLRDGDPRIAELGIRPEPYSHLSRCPPAELAVGYVIARAMFTSEDDLARASRPRSTNSILN